MVQPNVKASADRLSLFAFHTTKQNEKEKSRENPKTQPKNRESERVLTKRRQNSRYSNGCVCGSPQESADSRESVSRNFECCKLQCNDCKPTSVVTQRKNPSFAKLVSCRTLNATQRVCVHWSRLTLAETELHVRRLVFKRDSLLQKSKHSLSADQLQLKFDSIR